MAQSWNCRSRGIGERVFYAWYDEQASQLRMSIVSGKLSSGLPFGAPINLVEDPESVARQYLDGTDKIGWEDLEPTEMDESDESGEMAHDLAVFATEFSD